MRRRGRARGNERGMVLISVYLLVAVLLAFGIVWVTQALAELEASRRSQASLQALYLAEAGVDQALVQLRQNYGWSAGYADVPIGSTGTYSVQVGPVLGSGDSRQINSQGKSTLLAAPVERWVEVIVRRQIPPDFYDNVIWASQNLDFNGNAYSVTGDVRHGDTTPSGNMGLVQGTVTYDPATNPLPRLNFQQLYDIASAQGNLYDAARLAGGAGVFPDSFWYTAPTDPSDPTTGVPNVNYVTTDLVLNGNIGTIGGFFVVVGDVLTNPAATEDTTLNGNGEIEGAVYTTGDFRINGGGQGFNVDGGVWAGKEARLNGHTTLAYNAAYMNAIRTMGISADVQVIAWRDR